jgi:formate dehydrogenase subunit gamma
MTANSGFFHRNRAYFYTLLGLGVVGTLFVGVMMIMDWGYLFGYVVHLLSGGGISGVLDEPSSYYEQMKVAAFGPAYTAIAPEIIRASYERQLFIWYVFAAEIAIFAYLYARYGRKEAVITRPEDTVQVFTPFQRAVIWINVAIVVLLVISGFNITWSMRSEGGQIAYFLRGLHEVTGLAWIPVWLLMSLMAFKDLPILRKNSLWFFLPGSYKPMKRIIFIVFVAMGLGLIASGFALWFLHPDAATHAQLIQFKRAMLYVHFGASVLMMFFVLDFVYSVAVAIKGNLRYLWTGRFPREHLEQFDPDVLKELQEAGRA